MPASLTTMNSALKEYWENALAYQLNDKTLLLNRLDSTNENLYGRYALIPVHNNRNGGLSARGEYQTLNAAGNQGLAQANYDLKYLYGAGQVSGPGLERTSGGLEGSVVSMLDLEMNRLMDDVRVDCSRQLYGTGDSKITQCGVTSASATVVLTGTGFNEALQKGQLTPGMLIDIGTLANPVLRVAGAKILSVTLATPSITIDSAITTAVTDFVFRTGNAAASSVSYEMSGLQNLNPTAQGTFGLINPATAGNTYWDNQRINVAGNITLDTMNKAFNTVNGLAGGQLSAIITSYGIQRGVYNLLQSQIRYMDPMALKSGFQTLEWNGIPIIADKDAPYSQMHFLDERSLRVYANRDWHWLEEDGRVLKWTPNQDSWQFVLARYMNIGASRRNNQLVAYGVTVGGSTDSGI